MKKNRASELEIEEKRALFKENELQKDDPHYGWFAEEEKYKLIFDRYSQGRHTFGELGFFTRSLNDTCALKRWNVVAFRGTSFFFSRNRNVRSILIPPPNSTRFAWPIVFVEFAEEQGDCTVRFTDCAPSSRFDVTSLKKKASDLFHLMKFVEPLENFEPGSGKKNKTGTFQGRRNSLVHQCVQTPKEFYAFLDGIFKFDHDPCPLIPAADAMKVSWGRMNYVNPPFEVAAAFAFRAAELAEQTGSKTVMICPLSTNSRWFNELAKRKNLLAVIVLRDGLIFEGYKKWTSLTMNLLLIGKPILPHAIHLWFLDAQRDMKRRIPTVVEDFPLPLEKIGWEV